MGWTVFQTIHFVIKLRFMCRSMPSRWLVELIIIFACFEEINGAGRERISVQIPCFAVLWIIPSLHVASWCRPPEPQNNDPHLIEKVWWNYPSSLNRFFHSLICTLREPPVHSYSVLFRDEEVLLLDGGYTGGYSGGSSFALIVVLFVLLIIVGVSFVKW